MAETRFARQLSLSLCFEYPGWHSGRVHHARECPLFRLLRQRATDIRDLPGNGPATGGNNDVGWIEFDLSPLDYVHLFPWAGKEDAADRPSVVPLLLEDHPGPWRRDRWLTMDTGLSNSRPIPVTMPEKDAIQDAAEQQSGWRFLWVLFVFKIVTVFVDALGRRGDGRSEFTALADNVAVAYHCGYWYRRSVGFQVPVAPGSGAPRCTSACGMDARAAVAWLK